MIIVNGLHPLTFITKCSILDDAAVLNSLQNSSNRLEDRKIFFVNSNYVHQFFGFFFFFGFPCCKQTNDASI